MNLFSALNLKKREIISFVGGGGKTTLMFRLAEEIPRLHKTMITTTTKIYIPRADKYPVFITQQNNFNKADLEQIFLSGMKPTLGSEILPGNKLKGVSLEQFNEIARWQGIDFILVEADGSKGLPLKGHLNYEPVIPQTTTMLVIVVGADVLGKTLDVEYIHRPEVVAQLTGSKPGSIITPELVAKLIKSPMGIMRTSPPQVRKTVIINKVDCLESLDEAYQTAQLLVGDKIQKVILCSALSEHPIIDVIEKNTTIRTPKR